MNDQNLSSLANTHPVELMPPDLSPYASGSSGIPYVMSFTADAPGPHVALIAMVHGNEPCGAIALDTLLRANIRPARGTLSLGFANVEATRRFDARDPNATRWVDEDFNRLWSDARLSEPRESVELVRARELRPFIDTVDLLLDIHSMQHATEPLMMAGPAEKGLTLARAVGMPHTIVRDAGHAAGPRLRDFAPFVDPATKKNALLIECGQHWEKAAAEVALDAAVRFLRATEAVAPDFGSEWLQPLPATQRVIEITDRVTVESDDFAFAEPFQGMEVIAQEGTRIATDGGREVRTPYENCVLVMPSRRLWPGQTAVRLGRIA